MKAKAKPKKLLGFLYTCLFLGLGILPTVVKPKPALSAEYIYFNYGPLKLSLSRESLEIFANEGRITKEFEFYAQMLNPEALEQLRMLLQQRIKISPVAISRLGKSPMGEAFLEGLGKMIKTHPGRNGLHSLRGALVLAAADSEGLTIMNIVRQFPTEGMLIDTDYIFDVRKELATLFRYRDAAVNAIANQANREAAAENAVDVSQLTDLQQPGPYQFTEQIITLSGRRRQSPLGLSGETKFEVALYLPQGNPKPAPLVVMSHGFASDRNHFTYLAEHLASHGIAVAVPEHVGSNVEYSQAVLQGLANGINPVEFIERPLDIRYVLDELEDLSKSDPNFANQLNLEQVGVIGHSFGGYTALAVAGAEINDLRLRQVCPDQDPTFNLSVLLQCLANRLPPFNYNLRDPRVKAVIAVNPITSTALGPGSLGKIQVPVMIMAGSHDIVAPTVPEQIHPFIWLNTPEKYLAMIVDGNHFSTSGASGDDFALFPRELLGSNPQVGLSYLKALSLAFVNTHIRDLPNYRPYLSVSYAKFLSENSLKLHLVKSLTPEQLEESFGSQPPESIIPQIAIEPIPKRSETVLDQIKRTGTIKVGIRKDAAPFGYIDTKGEWKGYCFDLLNSLKDKVAQQLNKPIELDVVAIQSTLENRFAIVRDEAVNLECGPNTIRSDLEGVKFSTPFFITGTHFLVDSQQPRVFNRYQSLDSLKIGVLPSSLTETFIEQTYPNAQKIVFPGDIGRSQGVKALVNSDIDAFASDGILLIGEVTRQGLSSSQYTLSPDQPLTCDFYGMILPKSDPQWQRIVNSFIEGEKAKEIWGGWFTNLFPYVLLNLEYCIDK
ncbi:alpha/beta hydrolase [Moorena producens JHB]|uniref:Alpha/beta hydrolase n=1 Tax=Moorena producens (strain JHB) TaxID=1454205 RepID=A0A1D9FYU8_MOOP1|nr:alpha/beta fold hydrolase [Moorena producens]AOY80501.2 alpha/beta hydrolase [Moorena producens JHB]